MIPRLLLTCVLLGLLAGCRTAQHRNRSSSGPELVHVTPTEKQLSHRITELERAGHSKAVAEQKARSEFAKDAWQYDNTQAWANEKARAERSANREKMEKALARLPR